MTVTEVEKLLDNIGLCNYEPIDIDKYGNPIIYLYVNPYEMVITEHIDKFINSLIQYDGFKNERDVRNTLVLSNRPESNHLYQYRVQNRTLIPVPLTIKDDENTHYSGYFNRLTETVYKLLRLTELID